MIRKSGSRFSERSYASQKRLAGVTRFGLSQVYRAPRRPVVVPVERWPRAARLGVRSFAPAAAFGGMPPICSLALELFMSVFPLWFALARNVEPSSAKMRKTGHQITTTKIGQARAGFCRFTERSLFRLRSSRLPQASLLCERIRRSRNGSRACAALNNQPVRFPVTRSLPIEGVLTPPLAAMSSSNLVKSSYQSLAGRPCSPLPVNS